MVRDFNVCYLLPGVIPNSCFYRLLCFKSNFYRKRLFLRNQRCFYGEDRKVDGGIRNWCKQKVRIFNYYRVRNAISPNIWPWIYRNEKSRQHVLHEQVISILKAKFLMENVFYTLTLLTFWNYILIMNFYSVMQVLFTLPQFQEQYVKAANDIYESINFDNTGKLWKLVQKPFDISIQRTVKCTR